MRRGTPMLPTVMSAMASMALALFLVPVAAAAQTVTVLYDGRVVEVERTLADPNDLWVMPEDLAGVNGFELKPEGGLPRFACSCWTFSPSRRHSHSTRL